MNLELSAEIDAQYAKWLAAQVEQKGKILGLGLPADLPSGSAIFRAGYEAAIRADRIKAYLTALGGCCPEALAGVVKAVQP